MKPNKIARLMLLAICFGFVTSDLSAQAPLKDRWQVKFEHLWPASNRGTGFVRVVIRPVSGKAIKETKFTLCANRWDYTNGHDLTVSSVTIQPGDSEVVGELYVSSENSSYCQMWVETDGNRSQDQGEWSIYDNGNYGNTASRGTSLFVSSSVTSNPGSTLTRSRTNWRDLMTSPQTTAVIKGPFPDVLEAQAIFDSLTALDASHVRSSFAGLSSPIAAVTRPSAMPTKWIGLSGAGRIFISVGDLQTLSQKYPARHQALRHWTGAGGVLVVLDCGSKFERLSGAASALLPEAIRDLELPLLIPDDQFLNRDELLSKRAFNLLGQLAYQSTTPATAPATTAHGIKVKVPSKPLKKHWKSTTLDAGREKQPAYLAMLYGDGAVLFVADDATKWKQADWLPLFSGIGSIDELASSKQPFNGEGFFGKVQKAVAEDAFEIASLTKPPTVMFRLLVTLFILLAGPVSYFLLKRNGRLQLLFVTVPIISSLFCAGLLSYAIIADGFGIKGRRVTVTSIDQRLDQRSSASLFSIYSGLQPRPYEFSDLTYASVTAHQASAKSFSDWRTGNLRLSGGDIRGRFSHQVNAFEIVDTQTGIDVRIRTPESGEREVLLTNRFTNPISRVLVAADDNIYMADSLGVGETVTAIRIDKTSDQMDYMKESIKNGMNDTTFFGNRIYAAQNNLYSTFGRQSDPFATILSDLQRGAPSKAWLTPNSYVAFLDGFDEVKPPCENIILESDLNVIFGKW